MIALLILYINEQGYEVTSGEFWAYEEDGRHIKESFHYDRLAADLNLFKNGKYLRSTESHKQFGDFWKSLGGSWGGDFGNKDGNHYSLGESEDEIV